MENTNLKKITLHDALQQLKFLSNKIEKIRKEALLFDNFTDSEIKEESQAYSEYKKKALSDIDKLKAYTARRKEIQMKLNKANMETEVTLTNEDGGTYSTTIANLIYERNNLEVTKSILDTLLRQQRIIAAGRDKNNSENLQNAETNARVLITGRDDLEDLTEKDKEAIENALDSVYSKYKLTMCDVAGAQSYIEQLQTQIDFIESYADSALSVVNALTTIEITV